MFQLFFFYVQLDYGLKVKLAVDYSNDIYFVIIGIDTDIDIN